MSARTTKNVLISWVAALGFGAAGTGGVAAQALVLPEDAVPMTAPELLLLYGDRTWQWGVGGGYFDGETRAFEGRSGGAEGESTARGRWRITDDGQMCIEAEWVTSTGSYPDVTCFEHVLADGDIYQRKMPEGDWYVFKHANTEPDDEYNKLIREDRVTGASGKEGGV